MLQEASGGTSKEVWGTEDRCPPPPSTQCGVGGLTFMRTCFDPEEGILSSRSLACKSTTLSVDRACSSVAPAGIPLPTTIFSELANPGEVDAGFRAWLLQFRGERREIMSTWWAAQGGSGYSPIGSGGTPDVTPPVSPKKSSKHPTPRQGAPDGWGIAYMTRTDSTYSAATNCSHEQQDVPYTSTDRYLPVHSNTSHPLPFHIPELYRWRT